MVTNLFKGFFHPGKEKVDEMVVFLHRYTDYFNMVPSLFKNFLRTGKEKIAEMVIFLQRYAVKAKRVPIFLKDFVYHAECISGALAQYTDTDKRVINFQELLLSQKKSSHC
jgi:hypothetical protein